jgi:hypothetical protein
MHAATDALEEGVAGVSVLRRWRHGRRVRLAGLAAVLALVLIGAVATASMAARSPGSGATSPDMGDLVIAAAEDNADEFVDDVSADDSTDGDFSADDSTDVELYGQDYTNEPDEPDTADVSSDDLSDGDFSNENTDFAPDVTKAVASVGSLWPANNKMVKIKILGVTDKDGNAVSIKITDITSDESTAAKPAKGKSIWPDADGIGGSTATVRAECVGTDGRVYVISFSATDISGCWRQGHVRVVVPVSGSDLVAIDSGQWYDATVKN